MDKFYCMECKRFLKRHQVIKEIELTDEPIYFCRWCGESVIKTNKVLEAVTEDYIDYILSHGKREDFE